MKTLLERIADMAACVGGNVEEVLLDAAKEIENLRAHIGETEKQEPVAIAKWTTGGVVVHIVGDVRPGDILYLAPGANPSAKGEEK